MKNVDLKASVLVSMSQAMKQFRAKLKVLEALDACETEFDALAVVTNIGGSPSSVSYRVTIIDLVSLDSVDQMVIDALESKGAMAQEVLRDALTRGQLRP